MRKMVMIVLAALALVVLKAQPQTQNTKNGQTGQGPAAPVASTSQQQIRPNQQPQPGKHIKADVWIIGTPPKDRYDKAAFWISVALAGIGILGIVIAIWTVKTIKGQVDSFISKERARITVDIEPFNPGGTNPARILYDKSDMPPPGSGETWNAGLLIDNSGETNAFIERSHCKACIKATGWDPRSEIITPQMGLPKVMHPHKEAFKHSARIETGQLLRSEVGRETALAIGNGSMGIYVIGHIEFADVFDNRWIVKFCRKWGGWMFGGQWQPAGWYDYPETISGKSEMNAELRIKRPSMLRRMLRSTRKDKPDVPVVEIT